MFRKNIIIYIFIFVAGLVMGLWINISMITSNNEITITKKDNQNINNKIKPAQTSISKKEKIEVISSLNKQKEDIEKIDYLALFRSYLLEEKYELALNIYEIKSNNDTIYDYKKALFSHIKAHIQKTSSTKKLINLYLTYDYGNTQALYYLAQITYHEKKYFKAIKELYEIKESNVHEELEKQINEKLMNYITAYQNILQKENNRQKIKDLIIYILEKEPSNIKYQYQLAQYYFETKSYKKAKESFECITYNETYNNSIKEYLEKIERYLKLQNKFPHKIKLEKQNNHFYVNVKLDEQNLKLMIDTGATYTLINKDSLSQTYSNKPILLNTANGQIKAELIRVKEILLEDISLSNFEVTLSEFSGENFDGLLGMNFFKEFDFYIDQEASVLYLK